MEIFTPEFPDFFYTSACICTSTYTSTGASNVYEYEYAGKYVCGNLYEYMGEWITVFVC
jgi:hypothetical protein